MKFKFKMKYHNNLSKKRNKYKKKLCKIYKIKYPYNTNKNLNKKIY